MFTLAGHCKFDALVHKRTDRIAVGIDFCHKFFGLFGDNQRVEFSRHLIILLSGFGYPLHLLLLRGGIFHEDNVSRGTGNYVQLSTHTVCHSDLDVVGFDDGIEIIFERRHAHHANYRQADSHGKYQPEPQSQTRPDLQVI